MPDIAVPVAPVKTFTVLTLGTGLELNYLPSMYWLKHVEDSMGRLIALAGIPGVGKSSLARHLARRSRAIWLRIDSMDQAIWASGTAPGDLFDWSYRAAQAIAADNGPWL
jgi:hypothetical protein